MFERWSHYKDCASDRDVLTDDEKKTVKAPLSVFIILLFNALKLLFSPEVFALIGMIAISVFFINL